MLRNKDIPKEIRQVSHNIKIVYLGVAMKKKRDPWKQLTGKITLKQKVAVEDLLH